MDKINVSISIAIPSLKIRYGGTLGDAILATKIIEVDFTSEMLGSLMGAEYYYHGMYCTFQKPSYDAKTNTVFYLGRLPNDKEGISEKGKTAKDMMARLETEGWEFDKELCKKYGLD